MAHHTWIHWIRWFILDSCRCAGASSRLHFMMVHLNTTLDCPICDGTAHPKVHHSTRFDCIPIPSFLSHQNHRHGFHSGLDREFTSWTDHTSSTTDDAAERIFSFWVLFSGIRRSRGLYFDKVILSEGSCFLLRLWCWLTSWAIIWSTWSGQLPPLLSLSGPALTFGDSSGKVLARPEPDHSFTHLSEITHGLQSDANKIGILAWYFDIVCECRVDLPDVKSLDACCAIRPRYGHSRLVPT